jgi:hypothetical protein
MPAYNLALHGELGSYLERYPGLFGLYNDGLATGEPWVKDTGTIGQPLSRRPHARSFIARIYDTPPSSPPTPSPIRSKLQRPARDQMVRPDSAQTWVPFQSEKDWINRRYSPPQPEVRRSNAISRRQGRYFRTPDSYTHTPQRPSRDWMEYDFSYIDHLLTKLTALTATVALHVKSPKKTSPSAPVPLPRRVTDALNELYPYLYMSKESLLPPRDASQSRWYPSSPFTAASEVCMIAMPPRLDQELPAPLRSHPPSKKFDPKAGRFRAMRSLGYSVGSRRYLLPSIIALLTAKAVLEHVHAVLRAQVIPDLQMQSMMSQQTTPHGVPAKADYLLGISSDGNRGNQSHTQTPNDRRHTPRTPTTAYTSSTRSLRSSPTISVLEIASSREPVSAWSPWSPLSSVRSSYASSSIFDDKYSADASSRQTWYSSRRTSGINDVEIRVSKCRELGRQIESQLRTVGSWIWTNRTRWDVYHNADDEMWFVDRELERCRTTLVDEEYLK